MLPLLITMQIIVISWILGLGIIGINVYYLSTAFVGWLIKNDLPKTANIFIGIVVFPLMAVYVIAVIYLTFRKDTVVTFIDPTPQNGMEKGLGSTETDGVGSLPYREDLAHIPLPHWTDQLNYKRGWEHVVFHQGQTNYYTWCGHKLFPVCEMS